MGDSVPWPVGIRLSADKTVLTIRFDNEEIRRHRAEDLRVNSPSAEVQGHHPLEKRIVTGKQDVKINAVEPVGNYAIRLVFDDGHKTGLYSWDYLFRMAQAG